MDWLARLPWIGPRIRPWVEPRVRAALRTHAWRAFAHLLDVHWTRLAAAMTFTSFLALFPLITVGAAIGAVLLSQDQLDTLEHKISEQIPGIADQIDINGLVANAGTIGLIAGALLLITGIGWVGSLRDCLRAVWAKDNEERNPFLAKLADGGVLIGLGLAVLVSLGASAFATAAVTWAADHLDIDRHGAGRLGLTIVGYGLAVVADFLILTYLLTLLPGVEPPRRAVIQAALIGAIGFELLKVLLSSYLRGVAGRNIYGAFGTPVALLLWLNFMAKLLLYCAAWTATPRHAPPPEADGSPADASAGDPSATDDAATEDASGANGRGRGSGPAPGHRPGPRPEAGGAAGRP
jgi:membrane protein